MRSAGVVRSVPAPATTGGRAFEGLASQYDEHFTHALLGRLLRQRVWRRLDACFAPDSRILDLGCGTGEDAVHLAGRGMHVVAVDAAEAMVGTTRRKAEATGFEHRITVRHAAIESLADARERDARVVSDAAVFDGAFSNFGALNCCVASYASLARGLARELRPRAPLVLVVMGPLVPWEWAWYLVRAEPRRAFRRLRRSGVLWRGVLVRYPTMRTLRRAFGPWFRYRRASGLGWLLPPTYAERWAVRHPRLTSALDRWERRLVGLWPTAWLADHYILELERR